MTVADHPVRTTEQHAAGSRAQALLESEDAHVAHDHHPLDVVVASGRGAVLTDTEGREHLDVLAACSATTFGHGHPALCARRWPAAGCWTPGSTGRATPWASWPVAGGPLRLKRA